MNKYLLAVLPLIAASYSYAQNTFPSSGNVGIGTTTPGYNLVIQSSTAGFAFNSSTQIIGGMFGIGGNLTLMAESPSSTLGASIFLGGSGRGDQNKAATCFLLNNTEYMRIDGNYTGHVIGNVGIGTQNPDAKLSVAGTIHSQAVKVDMTGWSDFVFKKSYNLYSLAFVKSYIDQNHHLPDMPSEDYIVKNGLDLGEVSKIQTRKIEELTLYLIEKDKQVQLQQSQIDNQQQQIDKLNKKLAMLLARIN